MMIGSIKEGRVRKGHTSSVNMLLMRKGEKRSLFLMMTEIGTGDVISLMREGGIWTGIENGNATKPRPLVESMRGGETVIIGTGKRVEQIVVRRSVLKEITGDGATDTAETGDQALNPEISLEAVLLVEKT